MSNIPEVFTSFQQYLDSEHEMREVIRTRVRDIEATAREILIILQVIHQENGAAELGAACARAHAKFAVVREEYGRLGAAVAGAGAHSYRFHDHWRFVTQRLACLAALTRYLEAGAFTTHEEAADELGLASRRGGDGDGDSVLHLDLEDYLVGLLDLAAELARFSVNAVTAGDYARPLHVARFLGDLSAGFRLINFKNDSLRKRFDGLKYNVKKVEEVVYDLSIRGLKAEAAPRGASSSAAAAAGAS